WPLYVSPSLILPIASRRDNDVPPSVSSFVSTKSGGVFGAGAALMGKVRRSAESVFRPASATTPLVRPRPVGAVVNQKSAESLMPRGNASFCQVIKLESPKNGSLGLVQPELPPMLDAATSSANAGIAKLAIPSANESLVR